MANEAPEAARERPIDKALSLALSGESEPALRQAAAALEVEPLSPLTLLLTSRLLGQLGRKEAAQAGLKAAAERAIFAGNLPFTSIRSVLGRLTA